MKKITDILVIIFSFFLAFGKYDPFSTNGVYFDIIVIVLILSLFFSKDIFLKFRSIKNQIIILSLIGFYLFIIGLFYNTNYEGYISDEVHVFNFKYYGAIIIFSQLSLIFKSNTKLMYQSIFVFSLSCAIISCLHYYGYLASSLEFRNGRLIIFEENPNSISSRMAIALVVFFYLIVNDPLKFYHYRFILFLALPFLFFFIIETGSRGSSIAVGLGVFLILLFSKISFKWKTILFVLSFCVVYYLFGFILSTSLYERFNNSDLDGGRFEIWANTLEIFYNNPLGVGEIGYKLELFEHFGMTSDTHNLFLYMLVTGGFIVFILFTFFLQKLLRISFFNMKEGEPLGLMLFIFLLFLMSKTGGILTYLIMWYIFAIINASPRVNLIR